MKRKIHKKLKELADHLNIPLSEIPKEVIEFIDFDWKPTEKDIEWAKKTMSESPEIQRRLKEIHKK